jgi:EpsI family protein
VRDSIRPLVLLFCMTIAATLAYALQPAASAAASGPKIDLAQMVPRQFDDWTELPQSNAQIINPQQAEFLSKIYSQTLSRTYINSRRHIIMLSIAYGVDQSRDTQLHKPETCYPAQGFELKSTRPSTLQTLFGDLETTQMVASLGARNEPITYWMRVGDHVIRGGLPQTMQRLKLGILQGTVADGLLFRVSDISNDPVESYKTQGDFSRSLLKAASPDLRRLLIGSAQKTGD